ncbi:hypothetical protein JTM36_37295, partial [Pseudomonas aeruginosa]|nr:hypothetical protein [Pseudomonas aeruginosa]
VSGLTFVVVQLFPEMIPRLAEFTRVRLIRSLPELQEEWKLKPDLARAYRSLSLPVGKPISNVKAAIFDGGTANAFPQHVVEISSPLQPPSSTK